MRIDQSALKITKDENGFALLGTLLILVLLMVVGMISSTNTTLELQIAGNDRIHKETFYQADGGAQIGIRLVEESIGAMGPFTALTVPNPGTLIDPDNPNNTILIVDSNMSVNDDLLNYQNNGLSDANRHAAYYPGGYNPALPNTTPHTNILADGVTSTMEGAGLQMIAGYEGKGKGTAGGGSKILYSIYSQHMGRTQSESVVNVQWRHVIGLELEGRY